MHSKKIEAVIWDLDNTLYQFTDDLKYHCNVAAAKAVIDVGLPLVFEEALQIAVKSEIDYNYSLHEFILNHGLSYKELHHPFHDNIDETLGKRISGLLNCFEQYDLPHVVLTNASQGWARRVLKYFDLNKFFNNDAILCMENFGYIPKARGNDGVLMALAKLKTAPENTLIVDDLSRNLLTAKQAGLQTAITHFDNIHKGDHIDYYFQSTNDVFKILC